MFSITCNGKTISAIKTSNMYNVQGQFDSRKNKHNFKKFSAQKFFEDDKIACLVTSIASKTTKTKLCKMLVFPMFSTAKSLGLN